MTIVEHLTSTDINRQTELAPSRLQYTANQEDCSNSLQSTFRHVPASQQRKHNTRRKEDMHSPSAPAKKTTLLDDHNTFEKYASISDYKCAPRKQQNSDRLHRSRERNRIHARKTRQRKKEQMQLLTDRADELKQAQIRLKQRINEKNTASILVGLFACNDSAGDQQLEDPRVEALLKRPGDDIPDAAKLPELPALILPGQHNSKKLKVPSTFASKTEAPDDGIDYDLLGKDRSKCSAAELDQIRRERNRMHAKRTRDRKRLFMEEMADMCKSLEDDNELLQDHLDALNGRPTKRRKVEQTSSIISPDLSSSKSELTPPELSIPPTKSTPTQTVLDKCRETHNKASVSQHGVTLDQIKTLVGSASTFSSVMSTSAGSTSTFGSEEGSISDESCSLNKKTSNNAVGVTQEVIPSGVPKSITTKSPTAIGV